MTVLTSSKNLFGFIVLYSAILALSLHGLDPDFGWHLASGNYIVSHGLPSHDVFTYTAQDFPWINHEWLHDVFTVSLFKLGGYALVAMVFAAVWTGALFLASRRKNLIVIIFAAVSVLGITLPRPAAWGVFFFALIECMLESQRKSVAALLPLIMAVWANLHGSFPIGLFLIVYYRITKKASIAWQFIAASLAATVLNPYGPRIYVEIFRHVMNPHLHERIAQWTSFTLPPTFVITTAVLIAVFFAAKEKLVVRDGALLAILFIAFLRTYWYFVFFVIASQRYFEPAMEKIVAMAREKFDSFTVAYFAFSIPAVLLASQAYLMLKEEPVYPRAIAEYLYENPCPGRIFNFFDYGGYLIWKMPNQLVFIDGRMPAWTFGTKDYMGMHNDVINRPDVRKKIFSEYSVTCVAFSTTFKPAFIEELKRDGWQTVLTEPGSILLQKP